MDHLVNPYDFRHDIRRNHISLFRHDKMHLPLAFFCQIRIE